MSTSIREATEAWPEDGERVRVDSSILWRKNGQVLLMEWMIVRIK